MNKRLMEILREIPLFIVAEEKFVSLEGLPFTEEDHKEVSDFLEKIGKEFDPEEEMPTALIQELLPSLVASLFNADERPSFQLIFWIISVKLHKSYPQVYALLNLGPEDVHTLQRMFIVNPEEMDIAEAIVALTKISVALKLKESELRQVIYWTFYLVYPEATSSKTADPPNPDAAILADIIMRKFPRN